MNKPEDNSKYNRKKGDIEIPSIDPIYDVMSDEELDEANDRFSNLLEEDTNDNDSKN